MSDIVDVRCHKCGTTQAEDRSLPPDLRTPCPVCGSMDRSFTVRSYAAVRMEAQATLRAEAHTLPALGFVRVSSVLLQTLVIPAGRTSEGQLIKAVALPWFDIVALLRHNPRAAFEIPPEKWEEIVAGAYKKAGFDEVTLTPRSGDHGRDVIAVKRGLGSVRVIDQVKAYTPPHLVTADDVRALMGVLQGDQASKGFLTTTSDFAPRLSEDPLIRPFIPSRLGLINGTDLTARLRELAGEQDERAS
jgi:restriction system protein